MLESKFKTLLVEELMKLFPGCIVLRNDPTHIQGFPDLTIFYGPKWAVLECKRSKDDPYQPNQEYYLELLGNMSFSATIFPENKEAVINELQQAFGFGWTPRVSGR